MSRQHIPLVFVLLLAILPTGCKKFEGDVTTPAWLHLDSVDVVRAETGDNERRNGWFTSDIDAVTLTALFDGDMSETVLGTFQLPLHIPVLHDGNARYITIEPVIKQNGISATRIVYPFLQSDTSRNVRLSPGETTYLGSLTADGSHSKIELCYKSPTLVKEEFFENFEPLASALHLTPDAVEWEPDDAENACSGSGYGKIVTTADGNGTYFEITDSIVVNDPSKYLYVELDYRTDVEFSVGIRSPMVSGGNEYSYQAMNIYPQKNWTKIYINLGRLWAQMNHYPTFHIFFQTINTSHTEGVTLIDNLKVITM